MQMRIGTRILLGQIIKTHNARRAQKHNKLTVLQIDHLTFESSQTLLALFSHSQQISGRV